MSGEGRSRTVLGVKKLQRYNEETNSIDYQRKKKMMNNDFVTLLFAFMLGCNSRKKTEFLEQEIRVENYQLSKDCNIYKTLINDDKYIFRIAQAGYCSEITSELYLSEYQRYLNSNASLATSTGDILIEYYNLNDSTFLNEILLTSNDFFKSSVVCIEEKTNLFRLRVR